MSSKPISNTKADISPVYKPGSFEACTRKTVNGKSVITDERISLTKDYLENIKGGIVHEATKSIGRIRATWGDGEAVKHTTFNYVHGGTFFAISPDGIGITNWHVSHKLKSQGDQLWVDFPFISEPPAFSKSEGAVINPQDLDSIDDSNKIDIVSVPVVELASSPQDDLALIAIALPEQEDLWNYLSFNKGSLKNGDSTYEIGHFLAQRYPILTASTVQDLSYELEDIDIDEVEENWKMAKNYKSLSESIITAHKGGPGCSGSPLLNSKGEVLGVTHSGYYSLTLRVKNYLKQLIGIRPSYPEKNVLGSLHLSLEKRVFPFLQKVCKVNIDNLFQGKPLRFSNVIEGLFRKKTL